MVLQYKVFFYYGATFHVGQGLLIIEDSHSDTPHSVGLLWTSDQPDAVISTWQHTLLPRGIVGIEPTIPASERPQTHDLDSPATGINSLKSYSA